MNEFDFNLILAVLLAVIGVLAIACAIVAFVYVVLAHRLTLRMRKTVGQMEVVLARSLESVQQLEQAGPDSQLIPPMRIKVRRFRSDALLDPLIKQINAWLLEHSFHYLGQYEISHDRERLHVYLSNDAGLVAAIRQDPVLGSCYIEFCIDLGDGQRAGVSNPPIGSVGLPADGAGRYHTGQLQDDFSLLSRMWLEAKDIQDASPDRKVNANDIAQFFEEAHAAEMDWRVAQGGLTTKEIQLAFAAQGVTSTPEDVDAIQLQWQSAIDRFLLGLSRGITPAQTSQEKLLVVHDSSSSLHLFQKLGALLPIECEESAVETSSDTTPMIGELHELLRRFSPREAIARLRPLLPPDMRYQLVDQLSHPVQADVYRLPNEHQT